MMNWINEFYLMNKDQRVLTFRMEKNEFDEVTFKEVKEEKGKDFIEHLDRSALRISSYGLREDRHLSIVHILQNC